MEAASRGGARAVLGGVWRVFVSCSEQPAKGGLCPLYRQRRGGGCAPGGASGSGPAGAAGTAVLPQRADGWGGGAVVSGVRGPQGPEIGEGLPL